MFHVNLPGCKGLGRESSKNGFHNSGDPFPKLHPGKGWPTLSQNLTTYILPKKNQTQQVGVSKTGGKTPKWMVKIMETPIF